MNFDGNDTIKVCIGNYGYYNEGELRDKWIELPKTEEEIDRFLADNGLYDANHEEIYISDYDGYPFGLNSSSLFSEHTHLEDLNLLAMQIQNDPDAAERLSAVLDCGYDLPDSIVGLMNWLEQADDIPYFPYDYSFAGAVNELGFPVGSSMSPEEKLGWTVFEQNEALSQVLENDSAAMRAFDFEKYGEEFSYDCYLGPDGYIDAAQEMPDEDFYDRDELREMIMETWQRDREPCASGPSARAQTATIPIPDQRTQAQRHASIDGDARAAGADLHTEHSQSIDALAKGTTR